MRHEISIRQSEEPRTWVKQDFEHWAKLLDKAFQMDLDPAKIGAIEREWMMVEGLGPGRISLKRYKAILRAANNGALSEACLIEQEERLDAAFPEEAARDRVLEFEGVWIWD